MAVFMSVEVFCVCRMSLI